MNKAKIKAILLANAGDADKAAVAIAKEIKSSRMIKLSKTQNWFLVKAINLSSAVLPLEENVLSEEQFLADYGISKGKVNKELDALYKKLDK